MRETKVKVKIAGEEGDFIITGKVSTDFSLSTKVKRLYEEVIAESEMVRIGYRSNDGNVVIKYDFHYPFIRIDKKTGTVFDAGGSKDICLNFEAITDAYVSVGENHFDYTIKFKLHNGEVTFSGVLA